MAGAVNGAIVVYGRLQPIITTLATGAIYYGIALLLRPVPGGEVDEDLADLMTYQRLRHDPDRRWSCSSSWCSSVWLPFRTSETGRGCYAVGSAEGAAFMSGVPIARAKLAAYALSGFLAAIAGLLLTFVTFSGEASAPAGGTYTLNSIAAVVIGGTSLFGGAGSAIGSIFGAFVLRTIEDLLFVFDLPPLWQPLFQGVVLLAAVSLGAARVFRVTQPPRALRLSMRHAALLPIQAGIRRLRLHRRDPARRQRLLDEFPLGHVSAAAARRSPPSSASSPRAPWSSSCSAISISRSPGS